MTRDKRNQIMNQEAIRESILMAETLHPGENHVLAISFIPSTVQLLDHGEEIGPGKDKWVVSIVVDGDEMPLRAISTVSLDDAVNDLHKEWQKESLATANDLLRFVHE